MKKSFLTLFITVLLSVNSQAQSLPETGINVIGKATITATPDQYIFTVTIKEIGISASKTKALVDNKSQLVTNNYLSSGIKKSEIESSRLSMRPIHEKQSARFNASQASNVEIHRRVDATTKIQLNGNVNQPYGSGEEKTKISFEVSRTIKVTFRDFNYYDQLLDKAVKAGVSHISPLEQSIIDNQKIYQQALSQAIINASNKAANIATQLSVKLGNVITLKESQYHAPRAFQLASDARGGFNSQVGKSNVTAQVNITFAIKP
jgi:uncharacterized protein YggE